jgi:ubiquinone/menaquinone biosynthesis C-methylase UbiE
MKNPFKYNILHHYYFTFQSLLKNFKNRKTIKVLDYGSGDAYFLSKLPKYYKRYGYDVDKHKVIQASKKYKNIKFKYGNTNSQLPYPDGFFDVVFLFHVLEHVDNEKRVVKEIHRVLKNGGNLYISSPYKGLFHWADAANLRYYSPFLHKVLGYIIYGKNKYNYLFVDNIKKGLFGDSTSNRFGHKHYKKSEIEVLFKRLFTFNEEIYFSFLYPFLLIPYNIYKILTTKESFLINYLIWLDSKIRSPKFSYNFWISASKK